MKELCVAHLVRAKNGIKPFIVFLESYQKNYGGIDHDLLIIFKGFDTPSEIIEYERLLSPFRYIKFETSDNGFDITVYFAVIRHFGEDYRYFCFLNSYSEIQDSEWLRKLYENISVSGVGLVGATGSWNSHNSNARIWLRSVRALILFQWNKIEISNKEPLVYDQNNLNNIISFFKKTIARFKTVWTNVQLIIHFRSFPNYHIRTNAFMISSEIMKSLNCPNIKTKMDAYKFESGKRGLTSQILIRGKKVLVVGKDGVGYEKEFWQKSKTFWSYEQDNLLVADNQTRDYADGAEDRRHFLSIMAWGEIFSLDK